MIREAKPGAARISVCHRRPRRGPDHGADHDHPAVRRFGRGGASGCEAEGEGEGAATQRARGLDQGCFHGDTGARAGRSCGCVGSSSRRRAAEARTPDDSPGPSASRIRSFSRDGTPTRGAPWRLETSSVPGELPHLRAASGVATNRPARAASSEIREPDRARRAAPNAALIASALVVVHLDGLRDLGGGAEGIGLTGHLTHRAADAEVGIDVDGDVLARLHGAGDPRAADPSPQDEVLVAGCEVRTLMASDSPA